MGGRAHASRKHFAMVVGIAASSLINGNIQAKI